LPPLGAVTFKTREPVFATEGRLPLSDPGLSSGRLASAHVLRYTAVLDHRIVLSRRMSNKAELQDQLVELETKLAFQEQTIDTLNSVVTQLRDEVDRLTREVEALKMQLRTVAPSLVADRSEEKPPPHY